jgi:hypothetical protein
MARNACVQSFVHSLGPTQGWASQMGYRSILRCTTSPPAILWFFGGLGGVSYFCFCVAGDGTQGRAQARSALQLETAASAHPSLSQTRTGSFRDRVPSRRPHPGLFGVGGGKTGCWEAKTSKNRFPPLPQPGVGCLKRTHTRLPRMSRLSQTRVADPAPHVLTPPHAATYKEILAPSPSPLTKPGLPPPPARRMAPEKDLWPLCLPIHNSNCERHGWGSQHPRDSGRHNPPRSADARGVSAGPCAQSWARGANQR